MILVFLSTLSLRRATLMWWQSNTTIKISIHALLAESDRHRIVDIIKSSHFYPRSPCGERQLWPVSIFVNTHFYPRSPCGERPSRIRSSSIITYFYPRSPCGERLRETVPRGGHIIFLSTLSLRRATYFSGVMRQNPGISIHALLAESDMGLDGRFKL